MHAPRTLTRNLLLRSLSPEDQAILEPHLTRVRLEKRQCLVEAEKPIETAYFPEGGVSSMVSNSKEGDEIEIGVVGHEGVVPVFCLLGGQTSPHAVYVQIDGHHALTIPASVLHQLLREHESLRETLQHYAMAFLVQMSNTAVCNANAPIEQRLARWLLMCHDRLEGDELALTHEFIGMMLGVRRSSVTVSLHVLEGMGAVRSTRGLIVVLDRERLIDLAGETYGQPEAEYRRIVGPFPAD